MSISGANGANWGNGGFGAMSVIAVLARCLTVRVVPNVYGCPRAATPKFEAKRHGASDHSNNCRLVPLANILPQTLQALLMIPGAPREESMTETEMVIIGGGIAGASTAYHLAQHGHDVTLLERGDIASEASGVNAGSLGGTGWGHVPDLEAYLTMGSLEIFKTLQLDLGYDIEFRQSGTLQAI